MFRKEKIVDAAISAGAGFLGGALNEFIMRQAYLARLQQQGTPYEQGPPPTSASLWLSLMENPIGLILGAGITIAGAAADGKAGKFLTVLGAGMLGYVGGKFINNVLLPTVTEKTA
jgi:hypothetical protein